MEANLLMFSPDQMVDNVRSRRVSSAVAKPFLAAGEITSHDRRRIVNATTAETYEKQCGKGRTSKREKGGLVLSPPLLRQSSLQNSIRPLDQPNRTLRQHLERDLTRRTVGHPSVTVAKHC